MNTFTIIGNWKAYFSHAEATAWIMSHREALSNYTNLIICPSSDALASVQSLIKDTSLKIGGQDCAAYQKGAYTGQILATSLKDIGCSFCIIGHSETRKLLCQSDEEIAKKLTQLIACSITPILCIGENQEERALGLTNEILRKQFSLMRNLLAQAPEAYIAYEPIWAIGTGNAATPQIIQDVTSLLHEIAPANCKILYGGSVDEHTINTFRNIKHLNGFLVGKASTVFDALQKIMYTVTSWDHPKP